MIRSFGINDIYYCDGVLASGRMNMRLEIFTKCLEIIYNHYKSHR